MIKIRGNTAFQAIRGETFEKAVQINCLDTITKVTFQVPSLSINKELSLMNDVFYLRLESDETKDLTVGTFLYSLTIHFFSNGVRTVLYNKTLEVIDIALPPSENEPCPYDDYDITETYNVFSKTVDLTINLLDVIRVMSERFLFVDNLSEALKSYKLPFLAHVIQGEESYHFMVSLMDGIPTQYLISGNLLNEFILVKIRRFINDEWTSWEGVDVAYQFSLKADKTEVPILDEYGYIPEVYFADTLIDGGLFTSDLHANDIDGGSF